MSNYNHKFLDKTYQFGPFIYHCQLDPEFIKEFLRQGELATGEIITFPSGHSTTNGCPRDANFKVKPMFSMASS